MSVKVRYSSELYHHGILGMKWGIRRYQNPDGSYTPEGIARYRGTGKIEKALTKDYEKVRADIGYRTDKMFRKCDFSESESNHNLITTRLVELSEQKKKPVQNLTCNDLANSTIDAFHEPWGCEKSPINPYSVYSYRHQLTSQVNTLASEKKANIDKLSKNASGILSKNTIDNLIDDDLYADRAYDPWAEGYIDDNMTERNPFFKLSDALRANEFSERQKQQINIASALVNNLKNFELTYYDAVQHLPEAFEECGYSDMPISRLTDADWKKVYAAYDELNR